MLKAMLEWVDCIETCAGLHLSVGETTRKVIAALIFKGWLVNTSQPLSITSDLEASISF